MIHRLVVVLALMCCGLFAYSPAAYAAQSYDNCNNFIDTLPATISTQGVWCLHKDLSTNITSGKAITIAANNVTIDCNDFKLGGLAAGPGSLATGIYAFDRQNATIRHCNVRGFYYGVVLGGIGAGHLVEDNRLDNNLGLGIYVEGGNSLVRRNRVYDTGGYTGPYADSSMGIFAEGDIIDNIVAGVFADLSGGLLKGIEVRGSGNRVKGNVVSGFSLTATTGGASSAIGINAYGSPGFIAGNSVAGPGTVGISGSGITTSFCMGNAVYRFTTPLEGCGVTDVGGDNSNMVL
jgi:hypothetical protein